MESFYAVYGKRWMNPEYRKIWGVRIILRNQLPIRDRDTHRRWDTEERMPHFRCESGRQEPRGLAFLHDETVGHRENSGDLQSSQVGKILVRLAVDHADEGHMSSFYNDPDRLVVTQAVRE